MDVDWSRFRPVYESRHPRPLLGELEAQPVMAASVAGGATGVEAHPSGTYSDWGRRLAHVAPSHRAAELTTLLTEVVARTLGFDTPESVPPDRSFYDIGMDSLMMADLVGRLKARTGVPSSGLVFDHPTIETLAPRLLEALAVPEADETWPETSGATVASGQAPNQDDLQRVVSAEVAATLGFTRPDEVPLDQSFTSLGMDSLTSAELGSRLERRLGIKCSALIFDHPSVQALAAQLVVRTHPIARTAAASHRAGELAVRPAAGPREGIRGFVPEDEDEMLAFQAEGFPDRRGPVLARRWRWAFVDSARRLGIEPRMWVYRDQGAIVGQMASIPIELKVGTTICNTGWLVDSMVLPSHRDKAVGTRLLVQAQEDQPFSLSLGQTAEVREICRRLGWVQVAPLQTAMYLVNPQRVLRGKLPTPARWAAGIGLRAAATVRDVLKGRSAVTSREVERFGERHEALWECAAQTLTCAAVRDASYLNWKYVDRPGQSFLKLELLDGDALVGVAIWMFREPDSKYRYRRGFLVDVVAPLSNASRLEDIVRAASLAAVSRADALICLHIGAPLSRALHACGYQAREPERFLLVDPGGVSELARRILLAEQSWYVTQGDSDIDRP
jgi:acyl carrier protein